MHDEAGRREEITTRVNPHKLTCLKDPGWGRSGEEGTNSHTHVFEELYSRMGTLRDRVQKTKATEPVGLVLTALSFTELLPLSQSESEGSTREGPPWH